ncbi:hypothetical protein A6R68_00259 [Neotoma lepida]|uniref:G-protein coupled receptors family 1 profile domain-containing protein n=1 Tax=Neotoma lepida TaxID=56216 RepID=A0A1A6GXY9_NEOLE|nr:hypothetical protein A6R68_00259 [Neotoma lepida]
MLMELLEHGLALPVAACEAQLCITVSFGSAECFLLAAMAYDRYIDHFFCDFSPLLKLSCSDVSIIGIIPSISSGSIIVITVFVIAVSYIYILITILKMRSTEGRHKAFSTCTSHLTAVTLYYGTITFIYVMPKSNYSTEQNKVLSVFYTVVIAMLNPLIYSLRNRDVKDALRKATGGIYS